MTARGGHSGDKVRRAQAWRGNGKVTDVRRRPQARPLAVCGATVPTLGGLTGCVLDVGHTGDCRGVA